MRFLIKNYHALPDSITTVEKVKEYDFTHQTNYNQYKEEYIESYWEAFKDDAVKYGWENPRREGGIFYADIYDTSTYLEISSLEELLAVVAHKDVGIITLYSKHGKWVLELAIWHEDF